MAIVENVWYNISFIEKGPPVSMVSVSGDLYRHSQIEDNPPSQHALSHSSVLFPTPHVIANVLSDWYDSCPIEDDTPVTMAI